ncbi:hypothetical protein DIPPA_06614 [Diplonema papillatum]|nr:hypothetical protein DIPPA_06614 [Diplonema papillatum]
MHVRRIWKMGVQNRYRAVVVLTGAGISAESGIRTFRAADGLWEEHRVEDVATPGGFRRNPSLVHDFYNARRRQLTSGDVAPNAAHEALVAFGSRFKGEFTLVTQNIDDLHERAGSPTVLHMHGELLQARCQSTDDRHTWRDDLSHKTLCPSCGNQGCLRPDIVWFEEVPQYLNEIEQALMRCDLFVSIGTSGNVYPAAGFLHVAKAQGAKAVELNLDPSTNAHAFDESSYGLASVIVPDYFSRIGSA